LEQTITQIIQSYKRYTGFTLLKSGLLFELPLNALLVASNSLQPTFRSSVVLKLEDGSYIMRFGESKDPALEPIT